ncbi:MAG: Methylmalonyl-CoA mutase [Firmicutes bacterium]|nr:Methylmalonyl-CoA mutase [Bacillota bacterium]
MFNDKTLNQAHLGMKKWLEEVKRATNDSQQRRRFSTVSDLDIKEIYTPEDIKDLDFDVRIDYPGTYPFTRGCQPTGYRGKIWTFRMFSGFGSAEDTNKRWHQLLKDGETGLSTAFDFPTLMGYDSDSPKATAECGKCGVAIDTLADFEICNTEMIMSYSNKIEMSYCKVYNVLQKGGHYGQKGHYQDESERVEKGKRNKSSYGGINNTNESCREDRNI